MLFKFGFANCSLEKLNKANKHKILLKFEKY